MVSLSDADAEIENARREGENRGRVLGMDAAILESRKHIDAARADERKRIEDYIEKMLSLVDAVNELIRQRSKS